LKIGLRKIRTAFNLLKRERSFRLFISLIYWNLRINKRTFYSSQYRWRPESVISEKNYSGLKIAVTAHIFYEEYVDVLFSALNNIETDFTLLITTHSSDIANLISDNKTTPSQCKDIRIAICPNRGRNFGPLLVEFGALLVQDYDIFLHVHSKKSLHRGQEQAEWAKYLFRSLLGSKKIVNKIIGAFESYANIGLIYPVSYGPMPSWVHSWLQNFELGKSLSRQIGIREVTSDFQIYPVGGMFWARTSALKQLLEFPWNYDDFPVEAGQIDGTVQHVIERILDNVANENGMRSVFVYDEDLTEDRSFAWKDALGESRMSLNSKISPAAVLSWDLFDTLIFRKTGQPDFAKYQVGEILHTKGFISDPMEYVLFRNTVEREMRSSVGLSGDVSLKMITEEVSSRRNWDIDADTLNSIEFASDLATFGLREDIYAVFETLSHKSYVISDTYYSETQIDQIFERLNMVKPIKILASATLGRRKDRGDIWPYFLSEYVKDRNSYLHLGDNNVSDNQIPGDFGIKTIKIYSARDLLEIFSDGSFTNPTLTEYVTSEVGKKASELNQFFSQSAFPFKSV